jgi:hypothetical protein
MTPRMECRTHVVGLPSKFLIKQLSRFLLWQSSLTQKSSHSNAAGIMGRCISTVYTPPALRQAGGSWSTSVRGQVCFDPIKLIVLFAKRVTHRSSLLMAVGTQLSEATAAKRSFEH